VDDPQRLLDDIPLHASQRLRLTVVAGGVRIEGVLGEESARSRVHAQAHGGAVSALLDTAATFAVACETKQAWSTLDLRVDFLRPVPLGPIAVTGAVVRAGRRVARASADLLDGSGRRCAMAIATFVREEPPG
jgi:uncharacterized protein (TIGR00369 family)